MHALHLDAPPPTVDFNAADVQALIRRLYFHRFSARVRWAGLDPDETLQDVYVGLLTRARGRSAWNPERGALSTWLFVAMTGIIRNLVEKARRPARARVVLGREQDAAMESGREAGALLSPRDIDDLAADMEVPRAVVVALAEGGDPVLAALEAGMDVREAVWLGELLGQR